MAQFYLYSMYGNLSISVILIVVAQPVFFPACTQIQVSGASYQTVLNGIYINSGRTCAGRPRYDKSGLYLFYHDVHPESWGITDTGKYQYTHIHLL